MSDEESHLILNGPSIMESKISWMVLEVHGEKVQLHHLEGIEDLLAIIIQIAPGDTKFGQGVGGIGESGMGVQILEEFGKLRSVCGSASF